MPVNYANARIYAIRSPNHPGFYIGSTAAPLSRRMAQHRYTHKKNDNPTLTSNIIMDAGDAYIELIECYPCASKQELEKREGELIRATEGCINAKIAGRTGAEYYADNRERLLVAARDYAVEHKEHIREYKKQWHQEHREEIYDKRRALYAANPEIQERDRAANRERYAADPEKHAAASRAYVAANKEKTAAYQKEYRIRNREAINRQKAAKAAADRAARAAAVADEPAAEN